MVNLITLAGEGSRFSIGGGGLPKPLILVDGEPMVIRSVDCLPKPNKYVFVCRSEHFDEYGLKQILKSKYPNSEFITVNETTKGQACTAEIGILESSIRDNEPLLISCCDYGLSWDETKFEDIKKQSDIVVWSTIHNKAFSKSPESYSWLKVDGDDLKETYVKKSVYENPYEEHAIVGTFYFGKSKYFLDSLKHIYNNNITTNGEFYIDNIFNTVGESLAVKIFDVDEYHCWGTPKDLLDYENKVL